MRKRALKISLRLQEESQNNTCLPAGFIYIGRGIQGFPLMSQGSRWRDMSTVSRFSPKVSFRTRTRLSSTLCHQLNVVPTLKALRDEKWKYITERTIINTGKTKIPLSPDMQKFVFLQHYINLK